MFRRTSAGLGEEDLAAGTNLFGICGRSQLRRATDQIDRCQTEENSQEEERVQKQRNIQGSMEGTMAEASLPFSYSIPEFLLGDCAGTIERNF